MERQYEHNIEPYPVTADKYDHDGEPIYHGKHLDPHKWEYAGQFDQDAYYDGDGE